MSRTLTLVAVAMAVGTDYATAVDLVEQMTPTLPDDDIEAGRAVASAMSERLYPS